MHPMMKMQTIASACNPIIKKLLSYNPYNDIKKIIAKVHLVK